PHVAFIQFADTVHAAVQYGIDQFAVHELHDAINATGPAHGQPIHQGAANGDGISAQRQCFDDVGAATNAAVHNNGHIALQGLGNLRQNGDSRRRTIECAATMVGYLNGGSARFDGCDGIFRSGYALDDDGQAGGGADELQVVPGQVGLECIGV